MPYRKIENKYPKQIILISNERQPSEDRLTEEGFLVTWCPFEITRIMEVRDISNVLFLYLHEEDNDDLKRIGLYLRDLCIEEEKILYIYGRYEGVDLISSIIPSLFIRRAAYAFSEPFSALVEDMKGLTALSQGHLPGLLIVDDDIEYIEKLRPYLESSFRIYVSHCDLVEAGTFLNISDIVLVSVEAEYKLSVFLDFFRAVYARKKDSEFRLYYLTSDDTKRDRMNLGIEKDAVALSKSADISKIASFLSNMSIANNKPVLKSSKM